MMIASLPTVKALPRCMPDVSWIPSDVCAAALRDLVLEQLPKNTADSAPQVFHLANPRVTPWPTVIQTLSKLMGINDVELVSLSDYCTTLKRVSSQNLPIVRLLPFFVKSLADNTMPERYSSLKIEATLSRSPSLAACPEIGPDLLAKIVNNIAQLKSTKPGMPSPILSSPIYLFGPWSAIGNDVGIDGEGAEALARLTSLAHTTRCELGDDIDFTEYVLSSLNPISHILTCIPPQHYPEPTAKNPFYAAVHRPKDGEARNTTLRCCRILFWRVCCGNRIGGNH